MLAGDVDSLVGSLLMWSSANAILTTSPLLFHGRTLYKVDIAVRLASYRYLFDSMRSLSPRQTHHRQCTLF